MNSHLPNIVGCIFVLLGFLSLCFSIARLKKSKQSVNWPSCSGKLLEAKMVGYRAQGRDFSLVVKYQYTVGHCKFVGRRICFYTLVRKDECLLILGELEKKESITVFFNPQNHRESVLITGFNGKPYSEIFISFMAIFSGALVAYFF